MTRFRTVIALATLAIPPVRCETEICDVLRDLSSFDRQTISVRGIVRTSRKAVVLEAPALCRAQIFGSGQRWPTIFLLRKTLPPGDVPQGGPGISESWPAYGAVEDLYATVTGILRVPRAYSSTAPEPAVVREAHEAPAQLEFCTHETRAS